MKLNHQKYTTKGRKEHPSVLQAFVGTSSWQTFTVCTCTLSLKRFPFVIPQATHFPPTCLPHGHRVSCWPECMSKIEGWLKHIPLNIYKKSHSFPSVLIIFLLEDLFIWRAELFRGRDTVSFHSAGSLPSWLQTGRGKPKARNLIRVSNTGVKGPLGSSAAAFPKPS